jgi:Protein of unknown function (DUF998)
MSHPSRQVPLASRPDSSRMVKSELPAPTSVPQALLLWMTYGVAGVVLFPLIYLIEGATRPGYNAWAQAISALSLGPGGWIQQADFIVCGVSVLCIALVWRKILKGGVCSTSYPIMRSIEGLGLIVIGFFSQDPAPGYPPGTVLTAPTLHGEIHLIFTFVTVGAMALGFFVIAWRFVKEPHWRWWAAYSVISGLLTIAFMHFYGMGLAQHSAYAGVFERLATNTDAVWSVLVLARLWAGARLMRSNR